MTSASDWTGPVGDVWASQWHRTDRSFADLAGPLNAAICLEAQPGASTIVDIGCGAGATSLAIAARLPDARVTGVDLSSQLIAAAQRRAHESAGPAAATNFIAGAIESVVDALAPVDLFMSRHGVMFFAEPEAAFARLRAAAAPGGRLVFSCFRAAAVNPWASDIAAAINGAPSTPSPGYAPGPFAFADPGFVSAMLADAGWRASDPVAVDFRYRAGEGDDPVADALSFFQQIGPAAPMLRATDGDDRAAMLARIGAVCERYRAGKVVDFPAAAWLWSARIA